MPSIHRPRPWEVPGLRATPEEVWASRRRFLRQTALTALATAAGACGSRAGEAEAPVADADAAPPWPEIYAAGYPAPRSAGYTLDREITDEDVAGTTVNYYEFTTDKTAVREMARGFPVHPWTVEVAGLVEKPRTLGMEEILKQFPREERLYRHRCVEAWAMAVPWTGFPLAALVKAARPLAAARHVRFVSFQSPERAEGQRRQSWYPWPYHEGLRMDEALNPLSFMATGIYGHPLPPHHGAPLRLVVPWKYGYKSIKGIVQVEFVAEQPATFWNTTAPREYDYLSNVNPEIPHPRWSQATERLIGTGRRVPTLMYNGYGDQVAHLYNGV